LRLAVDAVGVPPRHQPQLKFNGFPVMHPVGFSQNFGGIALTDRPDGLSALAMQSLFLRPLLLL